VSMYGVSVVKCLSCGSTNVVKFGKRPMGYKDLFVETKNAHVQHFNWTTGIMFVSLG